MKIPQPVPVPTPTQNNFITIKVNKKPTWIDYMRKFWIPFITLKVIHYEVVED